MMRIEPAESCSVTNVRSLWRNEPHWHTVWPDGETWCYATAEEAAARAVDVTAIRANTRDPICTCPDGHEAHTREGAMLADLCPSHGEQARADTPGARHLLTEPHDGHAADERCPGCPHGADTPGADEPIETPEESAAIVHQNLRDMGSVGLTPPPGALGDDERTLGVWGELHGPNNRHSAARWFSEALAARASDTPGAICACSDPGYTHSPDLHSADSALGGDDPFFVSAGVEAALTEAARTGRDINIAGALYRKVNHGGPALRASVAGETGHDCGLTKCEHGIAFVDLCLFAEQVSNEDDAPSGAGETGLRARVQALADEWDAETSLGDPYHTLTFTFAVDRLRAALATPTDTGDTEPAGDRGEGTT